MVDPRHSTEEARAVALRSAANMLGEHFDSGCILVAWREPGNGESGRNRYGWGCAYAQDGLVLAEHQENIARIHDSVRRETVDPDDDMEYQ